MSSRNNSCQLSESTSKSEPSMSTERLLNSKSGTQQDKTDSRPLLLVTIKELTVSSLPTTSLTESPSLLLKIGWAKSRSTPPITFQEFWSETNVILNRKDKSPKKKAKRRPSSIMSVTWRPLPRTASTSKTPSPLWPDKSKVTCLTTHPKRTHNQAATNSVLWLIPKKSRKRNPDAADQNPFLLSCK